MTWLLCALLAPLLWSISNIIDKFAINNITSNYIPFIFLLSVGNLAFAAIAWVTSETINLDIIALLNLTSGIFIFLQYFAYSYALESMEVSTVIPIHQSEPVFVLLLSILIFNILPLPWQLVGFVMITTGIIALTSSRRGITEAIHNRKTMILLASALCGAISTLISDQILETRSLQPVLFFNYLGYALGGLLLLLRPHWRTLIIKDLRKLNCRQYGIFALTNLFDSAGYLFFMAALAVGGGAAIVSIVISIHPLFVFLLTVALTRYLPSVISEDISTKSLLRKTVNIVAITGGVVLIAWQSPSS